MFRVEGVRNFAVDQGYADTAEIVARAHAAAEELEAGGEYFSGGKIEYVLGSAERMEVYLEKREANLVRYA